MKFIELAIDNVLTLWVRKSSSIKLPESKFFYPQSEYIEIDAYLLNLVSRISDVKCYDNMFLTLESFKKQYQSIKQKEPYVRSSRSQMFLKIGALKNFAIFTGKHLCPSLFLWNFIKKRLRHSCFSVKEHFKRTFEEH